jgi:parvulin-like peptidyl-prolyl isomerase
VRVREAIQSLRTAVKLAPGFASAHHVLGVALVQNGDYEESIDSICEALQLESNSKPFKNALLNTLLASGRVTAANLVHGACENPDCVITVLLEKGKRLREILEKDGPEAAQVPALISEIYDKFSRSSYAVILNHSYRDAELRAVWDERREEIDKRLGSATVRLIQIRKHPGVDEEAVLANAVGILQKLSDGGDFAELAEQHSEGWAEGKPQTVAFAELPEPLNSAVFSLQEGESTRDLIEDRHAFYLIKVESRQAGDAVEFDDPKAQEAIKAVLAAQWRKEWEQRYLARLQDPGPDLVLGKIQHLVGARLLADGDLQAPARGGGSHPPQSKGKSRPECCPFGESRGRSPHGGERS